MDYLSTCILTSPYTSETLATVKAVLAVFDDHKVTAAALGAEPSVVSVGDLSVALYEKPSVVAIKDSKLLAYAFADLVTDNQTSQLVWDVTVVFIDDFDKDEMLGVLLGGLTKSVELYDSTRASIYAVGVRYVANVVPASAYMSFMAGEYEFNYIGQSGENGGVYLHYFEGAHVKFPSGHQHHEGCLSVHFDADPLTYQYCFLSAERSWADSVREFWLQEGALSTLEQCEQRLPQVAMVAYDKEQVAAVGTLFAARVEKVRSHMLAFRIFVGAKYRRGLAATTIINKLWMSLNQQYKNEELDPRIPGMFYLIQNVETNAQFSIAQSPRTGFLVAGFDGQDQQIRLKWFDGARSGDRCYYF